MYRPYILVPCILQALAWIPTRILLGIFCSFRVTGKSNLRGIKQAVFAVNHANELDPIILTAAVSPFGRFAPFFYLTAPYREFRDERFGWRRHIYSEKFFKAWGAYAPERGLKDYAKALGRQVSILGDGRSLCVFPEGGISRDGALREGHGGMIYLCDALNIPIIPVSISGSYKLDRKEFLSGKRSVHLTFGAPLYSKDLLKEPGSLNIEDYKQGVQKVMNEVAKGLS